MLFRSNPRLLFLDEPTSGLDPSGAVLFRKIIEQERKKGTTVFVTTHNMVDADLNPVSQTSFTRRVQNAPLRLSKNLHGRCRRASRPSDFPSYPPGFPAGRVVFSPLAKKHLTFFAAVSFS